jgi:DNA-directed RNA polymerase I and III subunit RPAC1
MSELNEKIQNINYTVDTLTFDFIGEARDANNLRKIFLRDIPTMAIHKVNIRKNNTVTNDDFIEHRLQMIPVFVDADFFQEKETFSLTLQGKGGTIYSHDIKGDYKCMPDIIITKMNENQSIEVDAIVQKGTAKNHVRWSCVSIAVFKKIDDNTLRFTVETLGVYTPQQLLDKALKIYNKECLTIGLKEQK